jgi:hypothetical protein
MPPRLERVGQILPTPALWDILPRFPPHVPAAAPIVRLHLAAEGHLVTLPAAQSLLQIVGPRPAILNDGQHHIVVLGYEIIALAQENLELVRSRACLIEALVQIVGVEGNEVDRLASCYAQ